jgi:SAM-dependent methyltransferase
MYIADNRNRGRSTFTEVAELYDRVRNRYPTELFTDLIRLARLDETSRILEIGTGTGIATLPPARLGCRIVGIELGAEMAEVARRKLADYPNVDICVAAFEEWAPVGTSNGGLFDLVMSATAFHWIDPAVRFSKSAALLRPGGHLAILNYWHAAGGADSFFERVQKFYELYMPGTEPGLKLTDPRQMVPDTSDLEACGWFAKPEVRMYITEETYTREQYIELLTTYSGHRTLDEDRRQRLLDAIGELIDREYAGSIRKCYLNELVVAEVLNTRG